MEKIKQMKKLLLFALVLAALTGCAYFPLRPGIGSITSEGAAVRQSQNPQSASTQEFEKTTEFIPTNGIAVRTTVRGKTVIGAAQKDTAREVGAKLASLSIVVWVGLGLAIFGAASFVYPPIKLLVGGSVTTSAVLTVAGVALIALPSLIVGHELLILSIGGGAALLYWFAHRHGGLKGALEAAKADLQKLNPPKQ
jgi:hypothetical protein